MATAKKTAKKTDGKTAKKAAKKKAPPLKFDGSDPSMCALYLTKEMMVFLNHIVSVQHFSEKSGVAAEKFVAESVLYAITGSDDQEILNNLIDAMNAAAASKQFPTLDDTVSMTLAQVRHIGVELTLSGDDFGEDE